MDVVVVGGGLEGLSVARCLAGRIMAGRSVAGRAADSVTVLERATLCSEATARSSGVVRSHYGVRSLAAMARYGGEVLAAAGSVLDEEVGFHRTGYLVGVAGGDALVANVSLQQEVGVHVTVLDRHEAAALWPRAHLGDLDAFAHEPLGGYGDGYLTGTAFARAAVRSGATVRQHAPVDRVRDRATCSSATATTAHRRTSTRTPTSTGRTRRR